MGFAISEMQLTSPAFESSAPMPRRHTGEGEDVSPELRWFDTPRDASWFAVICHDPDAPLIHRGAYGFVHWVVYNIPSSTTRLQEGTRDYTSGLNDFGNAGYGGPMPPEGHGTHHYFFWLLAIGAAPALDPGLPMWKLLEAVEPHVVAMNRLIGTYSRA